MEGQVHVGPMRQEPTRAGAGRDSRDVKGYWVDRCDVR